jgi:geranylgeranyl pyrophosphate synthase
MIADFLESLPQNALDRSKQLDLKIRSVNAHESIDLVLGKTVLRGGKRLRPLLTYLMSNFLRADFDQMAPYARATELVHAASLSHDDVIDNATLRRGAPSINIIASNKKAVLAGDYLLSSVIVDLVAAGNLDLVREMSLVIKDLSEGEWLQLDLIESRNYTRELIREVAMKKTSSVMSYCVVAPAIHNGESQEVIDLCREFGIRLGVAFQLIDDTLDYSANSEKDKELDLQNGIVNAVVFEMLEANPDLLKRFKDNENLYDLLNGRDFSPYVLKITEEVHEHLTIAKNILDRLNDKAANNGLISSKFYQAEKEELQKNIDSLELILTYMVLRQN